MDVVSVLICSNRQFLQHAAVAVTSALVNNPKLLFNVVLVTGESDGRDLRRFEDSVRDIPNCESLRIKKFVPDTRFNLPTPHAYTLDIYTRLWVSDFFSTAVKRVLYLDSDTVVVGDLQPLLGTDLQGRTLGAVAIPKSVRKEQLGLPEGQEYFNSGVLLIDLQRWREANAFGRLMAFLRDHSDKVYDPDQDALNIVLGGETLLLDPKWNAIRPFFKSYEGEGPYCRSELERIRREVVIVHFNGSCRPWVYDSEHPRKPDYWKYLRMTQWYSYVPPDRTVRNIIKKNIGSVLPPGIKRKLRQRLGVAAAN